MSVMRRRIVGITIAFATLLAMFAAVFQPSGIHPQAAGTPDGTPQTACASPVASPDASPVSLEGSGVASVTEYVTITLTDSGYTPRYVQATSGHDLTITLVNSGTRDHGFTIDHFDVDELLAPGKSTTIIIHNRDEIDVDFYSTAPCDDGMTGELTFYI